MPALDKSFYLDSIRSDGTAFVAAARRHMEAPLPDVPSCPGWNLADLVLHTGWVHRNIIRRVLTREQEPTFRGFREEERPGIVGLDEPYLSWALDQAPADQPLPQELLTWFEQGVDRLTQALEEAAPEEYAPTWFPPDQTAGFWQRRMAHETAVHRWDAQLTTAQTEPIEGTLARDGIDEIFDVMLPSWREETGAPNGNGETYHFHRTDGPGEWLVRFEPDGVSISREHGKGDVALRGTASDLLLFLWGRIPADRLEVLGDASLIDRYFELVPTGD